MWNYRWWERHGKWDLVATNGEETYTIAQIRAGDDCDHVVEVASFVVLGRRVVKMIYKKMKELG